MAKKEEKEKNIYAVFTDIDFTCQAGLSLLRAVAGLICRDRLHCFFKYHFFIIFTWQCKFSDVALHLCLFLLIYDCSNFPFLLHLYSSCISLRMHTQHLWWLPWFLDSPMCN